MRDYPHPLFTEGQPMHAFDSFFPSAKGPMGVLPKVLNIELTNHCNFGCLMCASGSSLHERSKGWMSNDTYRTVLARNTEWKIPLRFIGWGEPMLHPNLFDYLSAAKDAGLSCHMNTNGSLLESEAVMEKLILHLDSIKFSFQGVDREGYWAMRNCDFFDELLETIAQFHTLKVGRNAPFVHIGTSITDETCDQIASFRSLASNFADQVTISRTVLEHTEIDNPELDARERALLTHLKQKETVTKEHPECTDLVNVMAVNYDGSVSACCRDFDRKMVVGNLHEDSIESIWSSKEFSRYRRTVENGRQDDLEICRFCYDNKDIGPSEMPVESDNDVYGS